MKFNYIGQAAKPVLSTSATAAASTDFATVNAQKGKKKRK